MRTMLLGFSVVCAVGGFALFAPSSAGAGAAQPFNEPLPQKSSLTCFYDETGVFTGYAPAPSGAKAGEKRQTASSGAHAWSYTVAGDDPSACPAKLPVETFTEK